MQVHAGYAVHDLNVERPERGRRAAHKFEDADNNMLIGAQYRYSPTCVQFPIDKWWITILPSQDSMVGMAV